MKPFIMFLTFMTSIATANACPNIAGIYSSDKNLPEVISTDRNGTVVSYPLKSLYVITQHDCNGFSVFDKGYITNFDSDLENDYTRNLDDRTMLLFSSNLLIGTKAYGDYKLGSQDLAQVGFGLWGSVFATSGSLVIHNYNGFSEMHTQQKLSLVGTNLIIEERHADKTGQWSQWNLIDKKVRLGGKLPSQIWADSLSTGYKSNVSSFYFKDGEWRTGRLGRNGISISNWKSANMSELQNTLNNLDKGKNYLCEIKSHIIHANNDDMGRDVTPFLKRDMIYIESINNCVIKN